MSTTLTRIITILGGPNIPRTDLDWALDIPAGKTLLQDIAALLAVPDEGDDVERKLRATLRYIALEKEEVDILKHIGWKPPPSDTDTLPEVPEDYLPPSSLAKKATHLKAQTTLLTRELDLLKTQLKQSKQATHHTLHAIKDLTAQINDTERLIRNVEDDLSELSITADNALSNTLSSSHRLLSSLTLPPSSDPLETLSALMTHRSQLTTTLQSVSSSHRGSIGEIQEIQEEATRLDSAISTAHKKAEEMEMQNMLQKIRDGRLEEVLLELKTGEEEEGEEEEDDVLRRIEQSWMHDRELELDNVETIYDSMISALTTTLLKPLSDLHDLIQTQDTNIRETEAILGAFGDEMEDVPSLVRPPAHSVEVDEDQDTLQTALKSTLKHSLPNQILLTKSDILASLSSLSSTDPLPTIPATPKPVLLTTFHAPQSDTSLEKEAQLKSERLEAEVHRLEGEMAIFAGKGRVARRLERWIKGVEGKR